MRSEQKQLLDLISAAFGADAGRVSLSLRQVNEIHSYTAVTPARAPTDWRHVPDDELETHHWGFAHLNAESWRFYLPAFLAYAVRHVSRRSIVVDACLSNLRPPDRVPLRFATLTTCQRQAVVRVLEFLASAPESQFSPDARQVLDEHWTERPSSEQTVEAAPQRTDTTRGTHVMAFSTSNYDAMIKFLRDFGFSVAEDADRFIPFFESGRGARVRRGDCEFQLEESKSPRARACFHLFLTDFPDEEIERIKALGYKCDYQSFGHTHTFRTPDGGKLVL